MNGLRHARRSRRRCIEDRWAAIMGHCPPVGMRQGGSARRLFHQGRPKAAHVMAAAFIHDSDSWRTALSMVSPVCLRPHLRVAMEPVAGAD